MKPLSRWVGVVGALYVLNGAGLVVSHPGPSRRRSIREEWVPVLAAVLLLAIAVATAGPRRLRKTRSKETGPA